MRLFRTALGTTLLLSVCALHILALDEGAITKKVLYAKDKSYTPKIAIDQKKGTVAVLWANQPITGSQQTTLVTFIKAKNSKKIQSGKAQQVNVGGNIGGIAFSAKSKRFATVWDNEPRDDFTNASIFSRIYSRKGVSTGSSITQQVSDISNQNPNIFFIPGPNTFLVVFQKKSTLASQRPRAGLFSMMLNSKGKRMGAPTKIKDGDALRDGTINLTAYASDAAYNSKSKRIFVLVVENASEEGSIDPRKVVLYQLTTAGKLISSVNISNIQTGKETISWYSGISQQNKASSAYHFIAYCYKNNLIVKRISSTGKVEKLIGFPDVPDSDYTDIAYNPQDDMYLLVSEEKEGLSARYLDPAGNVKGKPYILSNNSDATRCTVAYNQKMKEFFIVWVESKNVNDLVMLSTLKGKP